MFLKHIILYFSVVCKLDAIKFWIFFCLFFVNQTKLIKLFRHISGITIGCSFKFPIKVGVEESIVNALRITDQLLKSYVFTRVVRSQSTLQRQL
jgi:hypothetical protein